MLYVIKKLNQRDCIWEQKSFTNCISDIDYETVVANSAISCCVRPAINIFLNAEKNQSADTIRKARFKNVLIFWYWRRNRDSNSSDA